MTIEHATGNSSTATATDTAAPAMRPRIFILSDVRLLCDGLVLSLAQQPSVIVAGAADLSTAPAQIIELAPDVLLLDAGAPAALEAASPCRQALPRLKVVAIAVADVEQDVFACARAGVSGFVSRNGSIQDLVQAIHCAMRNAPHSAGTHNAALTRREHEIVSLVSAGLSNKEIARQLHIQNATVKNHIHSILGKLQARRRGEIAARMCASGPRGWGIAALATSPARTAHTSGTSPRI
jgi:DNA-binding NarL/FixJ family response regulator